MIFTDIATFGSLAAALALLLRSLANNGALVVNGIIAVIAILLSLYARSLHRCGALR